MEVSKLTLSKELTHQTSSMTKVLLWMKNHPEKCRRTNVMGLAKTIGLDRDVRATTGSIEQYIHRLQRKGLIIRDGGRRRADFMVNYGHPEMPPIVDGDEVKTTKVKDYSDARAEGRQHFLTLQKAEADGLLSQAKSRSDIALLAGFDSKEASNNKRGYSWASNLIRRGHIKEEWESPTEVHYSIVGMPDYENKHLKKPRKKNLAIEKIEKVEVGTPQEIEEEPKEIEKIEVPVTVEKEGKNISITITLNLNL